MRVTLSLFLSEPLSAAIRISRLCPVCSWIASRNCGAGSLPSRTCCSHDALWTPCPQERHSRAPGLVSMVTKDVREQRTLCGQHGGGVPGFRFPAHRALHENL